jgi:Rrf2 family iron-sulfur cluster assembly transcriptional regulator
MRLTTKGRYAVTAMVDLAYHGQNKPVTLTEIAARQTISLSYLEQLFAKLRKGSMVTGVRGPGGGYKLSRNAFEINIAEIVSAVDEPIDSTKCGGKANCQDNLPCLTHDLWMGLNEQIQNYLKGISLGDLLEKEQVSNVAKRQDQQVTMQVSNSKQGKEQKTTLLE